MRAIYLPLIFAILAITLSSNYFTSSNTMQSPITYYCQAYDTTVRTVTPNSIIRFYTSFPLHSNGNAWLFPASPNLCNTSQLGLIKVVLNGQAMNIAMASYNFVDVYIPGNIPINTSLTVKISDAWGNEFSRGGIIFRQSAPFFANSDHIPYPYALNYYEGGLYPLLQASMDATCPEDCGGEIPPVLWSWHNWDNPPYENAEHVITDLTKGYNGYEPDRFVDHYIVKTSFRILGNVPSSANFRVRFSSTDNSSEFFLDKSDFSVRQSVYPSCQQLAPSFGIQFCMGELYRDGSPFISRRGTNTIQNLNVQLQILDANNQVQQQSPIKFIKIKHQAYNPDNVQGGICLPYFP